MTKRNDIKSVGIIIVQIKDKVENFPSWKDLSSDAEYEDVVNTLLAEVKQLLAAHLKEYKALAKQKDKTSRYEEVEHLLSQLEVIEKQIEELIPEVLKIHYSLFWCGLYGDNHR